MKKRNFYPRQVLQKLAGKETDTLSESQVHALRFFMLRARKYDVMISLLQDSPFMPDDESRIDVAGLSLQTLTPRLRVFVRPPIRLATLDVPCAFPLENGLQSHSIDF
ncbi:hypothetical protein ACK249_005703 [Pseudomonas aeruginosa]|uniref:hypothetical protein n=1 Tax=Pseudomonas aeruginosa TaxID=287 RepID=UPI00155ED7ED|nr:hypothetical protein [Pseudomonas aeruginosa]EKW9639499.1 hypothetical protein [Pseudomonas aeruginosa]NRC34312.1 hypothetical protein [Pseudomonas aeruginosa]